MVHVLLCQTILFCVHVYLILLEIHVYPIHAPQILVKTTEHVLRLLMALFHAHAKLASLAINVKQTLACQILV